MNFKHIHIVGVCGTLMGSFAAFLKRQGIRVTGSDQNVYPPMSDVLQAAGVELFSPYSEVNLDSIGGRPDLVVVGNVIGASNPEIIAFQKRGDALVSLPEFMEKNLLVRTRNLVVSGTHGKTTTSSMLTHVLTICGEKPSYFIGGVSLDVPHSFNVETTKLDSGYFILEGDEYDTVFWDKVPKFNHYLPNDVILTSVEFDHADIYADLDAVKKAFKGLVARIREPGRLIACIESENVRDCIQQAKVPLITYARSAAYKADYYLSNVVSTNEGIQFQICRDGKVLDSIQMLVPGEHNALNALAVWIECSQLGIDADRIKKGLSTFRGVKRRQEERGESNGVLVIDDFAHHPTAVKETVGALKAKYKGRKLHVVFEPRSATSRRKVFQKEYGEAFNSADDIYIAGAFDQSKIPADQQFSSQDLVADLTAKNKTAFYFEGVEQGIDQVAKRAKKGDVVAVLSNGGFGGFIPKLLAALKEQH